MAAHQRVVMRGDDRRWRRGCSSRAATASGARPAPHPGCRWARRPAAAAGGRPRRARWRRAAVRRRTARRGGIAACGTGRPSSINSTTSTLHLAFGAPGEAERAGRRCRRPFRCGSRRKSWNTMPIRRRSRGSRARRAAPMSCPINSSRPALGRDGEVQQAQQAGLAGAGGAEQPAEAALRNAERQAMQDGGGPISQPYTVQAHHPRPPARCSATARHLWGGQGRRVVRGATGRVSPGYEDHLPHLRRGVRRAGGSAWPGGARSGAPGAGRAGRRWRMTCRQSRRRTRQTRRQSRCQRRRSLPASSRRSCPTLSRRRRPWTRRPCRCWAGGCASRLPSSWPGLPVRQCSGR